MGKGAWDEAVVSLKWEQCPDAFSILLLPSRLKHNPIEIASPFTGILSRAYSSSLIFIRAPAEKLSFRLVLFDRMYVGNNNTVGT
jgi:hypothetical protein